MNSLITNQKVTLILLILVTAVFWVFSKDSQNEMKAMLIYNPVGISFFSITWTIGMAAMMLPSIAPMILLYNRLIRSDNGSSNNTEFIYRMPYFPLVDSGSNSKMNGNTLLLLFHCILNIVFVGSYLVLWTVTGIALLFACSIPTSTSLMNIKTMQQYQIVLGIILIISGTYQFSLLKRNCLVYCEPTNFFIKKFSNGISGALSIGISYGIKCIGSCWPYCLLMISLGWMGLLWMGLFTGIIFAERMWSQGIWISRIVGIALAITGIMAILGQITIPSNMVM